MLGVDESSFKWFKSSFVRTNMEAQSTFKSLASWDNLGQKNALITLPSPLKVLLSSVFNAQMSHLAVKVSRWADPGVRW